MRKLNNEDLRYILKVFTIVDKSDIEEKNSNDFKKILKKLVLIEKQITTNEKYTEDMKEYQIQLREIEKEEVK